MFLPERGGIYKLLEKYSPNDLVVYDMAMFYAKENGRSTGGSEPVNHIGKFYEINISNIARTAWLEEDEVLWCLEETFGDRFELMSIETAGEKKFFIKEAE